MKKKILKLKKETISNMEMILLRGGDDGSQVPPKGDTNLWDCPKDPPKPPETSIDIPCD